MFHAKPIDVIAHFMRSGERSARNKTAKRGVFTTPPGLTTTLIERILAMAVHTNSTIQQGALATSTLLTAPGRMVEDTLPAPNLGHFPAEAPEAGAKPNTSRRHVLAALSGAAFAGGALVLAMPSEAPAIQIIKPSSNPDATLLATCAEYLEHDAMHRRLQLIIRGDDETAADAAYEYCDKIAWIRVDELAHIIIGIQATTSAGVSAKAKVLACHLEHYVVTSLDGTFEDEAQDYDILAIVNRHAKGTPYRRPKRTPLPMLIWVGHGRYLNESCG